MEIKSVELSGAPQALLREKGLRPFLEAMGYEIEPGSPVDGALTRLPLADQWDNMNRVEVLANVIGVVCGWRLELFARMAALEAFAYPWVKQAVSLLSDLARSESEEETVGKVGDAVDLGRAVVLVCTGVRLKAAEIEGLRFELVQSRHPASSEATFETTEATLAVGFMYLAISALHPVVHCCKAEKRDQVIGFAWVMKALELAGKTESECARWMRSRVDESVLLMPKAERLLGLQGVAQA